MSRSLTKALLARDFGLQLHLPLDRLCPPVPIRWLYARWVQDLVESTRPGSIDSSTAVTGLDIGVGASCIYPLLICAAKPESTMYGTDIDITNYQHAVHNVSLNEWDDRIKLAQTKSDAALIPLNLLNVKKLDFTMCNPPFFATKDEALATFSKEQQPFAACTGADVEMVTPGGEVAYVRRMMQESFELQDKVQWYTVQLGKLSSLHALVRMLREEFSCKNWVITVLQPSGATVRWALGWSWLHERAPDGLARHRSLAGSGLQLEPNELVVADSLTEDPQSVLQSALRELPLCLAEDGSRRANGSHAIQVYTDTAVWSRSERRKRQRAAKSGDLTSYIPSKNATNWSNAFAINTKKTDVEDSQQILYSVTARWQKGDDRAMFESFCGMLKAKLITK